MKEKELIRRNELIEDRLNLLIDSIEDDYSYIFLDNKL